MPQKNNVSVIPAFNLTQDTVHTGLVIRQIDQTHLTMPVMGVPHTHNFYTISVLAQGTMTLYTDYEQIQVQAPALLLLGKDQVHAHNTYQQVVMTSLSFTDWFTIDTNPDWSIKEIAWYLGFTREQYFSRFFKKHTGHTPSRFQKLFGHMYK